MNNERTIRKDDFVYAPHFSKRALKVQLRETNYFHNNPNTAQNFKAINEDGSFIYFDEFGKVLQNHRTPLVFLATNENRISIQNAYGIELENSVVNTKREELLRLIDELVAIAKETYKLKDNYNGNYFQRQINRKKDEIDKLIFNS